MARVAKPRLFLLCLFPLARLLWFGVSDGLGANPIEFITCSTGTWTLVGLLLTLAATPLRRLSGWNGAARYRRMLRLFAFFYASPHFATYAWLDEFFDPAGIARDIVKRRFVTVGLAAFVPLLPLAPTSTQAMMRRLGRDTGAALAAAGAIKNGSSRSRFRLGNARPVIARKA